ncbi:MAG: SMI1/KNR4 family protein [Oscillospiraceae bacterium]|nr:SMI1/KNR4 family protein [Oscillospiraceae bacterium]
MNNQFYRFLSSLEDISFRKPTDEELQKLKEISSGKLPELFMEVYRTAIPEEDVESGDFVFYGIERMYEENTDYIPGANILPFGLFTFASTFTGDAVCMDLNDPQFSVYLCSHELLCDEEEICCYEEKMEHLPFTYENVLKVSHKLADSFAEFVKLLAAGEL